MLNRLSLLAVALLLIAFSVRPAAAQDLTTAEEVLKANLEATGGEAAWNAVKDLHVQAEIVAGTPMGDLKLNMEMWSIFPGYGFTQMNLTEGPDAIPADAVNMKAYYTPLEGWVEQGGQRQDIKSMPAQMRDQFMRQSPKSELQLLSDEGVELSLKDAETFNERPVYVVGVNQADTSSDLLIDKETLLVLAQRVSTPMGDVISTMGEYIEVEGLLFSSGQSASTPQGSQTVTFKTIELNKGLTPAALATQAGARKQAMPE
jgi:hypothetical protein